MSATTDVAIKTTCVADAILAMVAILDTEDAGRAAGTTWTVASASEWAICRILKIQLFGNGHIECMLRLVSLGAPIGT